MRLRRERKRGRSSLYFAFPARLPRGWKTVMIVTINGENREIADGSNVVALLADLGLAPDRVAIEHNRDILPRARWNETLIQPGDTLEIVHLVGGG